MSEERAGMVVDARVHAVPAAGEIERRLPERWSKFVVPYAEAYAYLPPIDPIHPTFGNGHAAGTPAGTDPDVVHRDLVQQRGVDAVVLTPRVRGFLPDLDFSSAIATATNEWLAETWLAHEQGGRSLFGSIRVDPRDVPAALAEIERWADHPAMVQVLVPLQSHTPYGHRQYRPVWQAAAERGLPVMTILEVAAGVEFSRTPVGDPRLFAEYVAMARNASLYHFVSLALEGVLEEVEDLTFIFGDGGGDVAGPFVWRLEKFWRGMRGVVPWVDTNPATAVWRSVRFVTNEFEGPTDPQISESWLKVARGPEQLLFGSNYPNWDFSEPADAMAAASPETRDRILGGNALDVYTRLAQGVRSGA